MYCKPVDTVAEHRFVNLVLAERSEYRGISHTVRHEARKIATAIAKLVRKLQAATKCPN